MLSSRMSLSKECKKNGELKKIFQIADLHFAHCLDVLPSQYASCSDLNTTAFIQRIILSEKPNLIVFTAKSMGAAFAPAIASYIPWVAVLGNHDQEGSLSREGVMKYIAGMKNTLSVVNPPEVHIIDGFGNYNLEVGGVEGTDFENKSVLNLYFLDSGDYSKKAYMNGPVPQKEPAPGLAYFHIPLPKYASFDSSNFTGVKQEGISSNSVNSGFFTTLIEAGDVKAVFTGHDHVNDFCGKLTVSLEKTENGRWEDVKSIKTWKRLDDQNLTGIDGQATAGKNKMVALENLHDAEKRKIANKNIHFQGEGLPWLPLVLPLQLQLLPSLRRGNSGQKNGSGGCFLSGRKLRVKKERAAIGGRSMGTTVCAVAEPDRPLWFPGSTPPPWLDGTLPGDFGFDPLGLGSDPESLRWNVQAELVHCRWAMLGAAGIFIPEFLTKIGVLNTPSWYSAGELEYFTDTTTLFIVELFFIGWAEGRRWADIIKPGCVNTDPIFPNNKLTGTDVGYPGGLWFDPLGWGTGSPQKIKDLRTKEIKNGRLAMLAVMGAWFQHIYTATGPIDNLFAHLADPGHATIFAAFTPK
ncbi:Chlorophyll a-b binding protein 7, chloroplastic [Glycine soja]